MDQKECNVEKAVLKHLTEGNSPLLERIRRHNQIILHNYQIAVNKEMVCALEGCGRFFFIKLIPSQILYPKFCEKHRTEHRRQQFRKPRHL